VEYRKLIVTLTLIFISISVSAQENKFTVTDSISEQLYNSGNWKQLIILVNKAVADSLDFPSLRFRSGYAYMMTGNYKAAISQFNQVLNKDRYNSAARLYAYYCNTYLNNNLGASSHVAYLDKETQHSLKLSSYGLLDAQLESGFKLSNNSERATGFFEHIDISNRLSWRLQLEQSIIFFRQNILLSDDIDLKDQTGETDDQTEYFVKAKFALTQDISLLGSYHYLNTNYRSNINISNLGLFGVKYTGKLIDLQADINFGRDIDETLKQYNVKLDLYPAGNLNIYTISRASFLDLAGAKHLIYSQALGFKILKKTWLETSGTFGDQDDYMDADGLYVYNAIDPTKFKFGEIVFFQLAAHTSLDLSYIYERKTDIYRSVNYNQHSVTLGILWRF
jgi:tetratricopeptide (TPR) repeat protein